MPLPVILSKISKISGSDIQSLQLFWLEQDIKNWPEISITGYGVHPYFKVNTFSLKYMACWFILLLSRSWSRSKPWVIVQAVANQWLPDPAPGYRLCPVDRIQTQTVGPEFLAAVTHFDSKQIDTVMATTSRIVAANPLLRSLHTVWQAGTYP